MGSKTTSLLHEFVDRRRKLVHTFAEIRDASGVYIVADNYSSQSTDHIDPVVAATISSWLAVQGGPLDFAATRHIEVASGSSLIDVLIVGTGGDRQLSFLNLETLGGSCYSALEQLGLHTGTWVLDPNFCAGESAAHFVFGVTRRSYDTNSLCRSKSDPLTIPLNVCCGQHETTENLYQSLSIQSDAIDVVRDLVNAPPNYSTPPTIVDWLAHKQVDGLSTRIIGIDESTKDVFPGTAAVGRSSVEEPAIFVWEWRGPNGDQEIEAALLGKGITFDAGGLSLKSHDHQFHMKTDLGGAAAVAGAMQCIAGNGIPIGVVGLASFAENLPGADAVRPGDVLTMANGATVEISFPDAEGRLVLSDLLVYAERKYNPRFMIDVATLTGTVIAALGTETIGCFCPDKELRTLLSDAANTSGEPIWQLPVGPHYLRSLESGVATLKNMPAHGRMGILEGSASVAASFLRTFVEKSQWAHLDIAGTVWRQAATFDGPANATGSGARLLYETICQMCASNSR